MFHDVGFDTRPAFVALFKLTSRTCSRLVTTRDLILANLREADLNKLAMTRAQLIDTLADQYPKTARWVEAFHDKDASIAGLVWTSKRCDPQSAYVIFGDQVMPNDLAVVETTPIASSADLLDQARRAGRRAGITLTV